MGKRYFYIFALFVLSACISCNSSHERVITVTIMPQKYIAEQIAGEHYRVNCAVPANANPEAYDITPAQMAELSKSAAYMQVGTLGFELTWMNNLRKNNPQMKVYDMSAGIEMIQGTHAHSHADGSVHRTTVADPHVWSSPKSMRIMADNVYEALVELDPDNRSYYEGRYEALVQRIDSIDAVVADILKPVEGRAFAIYHPSLTYLARDYSLKQISIENIGKENSAYAIKSVMDEARDCGVKIVFIQKEFDSRQVQTFADELGAKVYTINPLSYDWESEIINIANAIAQE